MIYDCIVIGAGLAGLGACMELSKKNKTFLLLEKMSGPGGDTMSHEFGGHRVDLAVQFGSKLYTTILHVMKEIGVEASMYPITFASSKYNNINPENRVLKEEALRFLRLTKEPREWWKVVDFQTWLNHYHFSLPFLQYVIDPMMSILLSTNKATRTLSAFNIIIPLSFMVSPFIPYTFTWNIKGGMQKFADRLIDYCNIHNNIVYNTQVKSVTKEGAIIKVLTYDNKICYGKNVIFTVRPGIVMDVYKNKTLYQKWVLSWIDSLYQTFYGVVHRDESVMRGKNVLFYYDKLPEGEFTANGPLGHGFFLSGSYSEDIMKNLIPVEKEVKRVQWPYLVESRFYSILINTWFTRLNEKNVKFAGGWTKSVNMENAFVSGIEAVRELF